MSFCSKTTWDIEIFVYISKKNGNIYKVFSQKPEENDEFDIKSIIFKMKPFTWGLHCEINKQCTKNGNLNEIDYLLLKEKKLVESILDWDIVDKNGIKIEVTRDNIFNLHPSIAEKLLEEYDKLSFVSKDEKRQLTLQVNKYYMSQVVGTGQVSAPFEIIELSLMEEFGWTPEEIERIPYKKLQELFLIRCQKEISIENAQKTKAK